MVNSIKGIPGKSAELPSYIYGRMVELDLRPTLTHLALGMGVPKTTLGKNLKGECGMSLKVAVRMAEFLKVDLTELVQNAHLT